MSLKVMKGVAYTQKRLEQWLKEDGIVFAQPKRDEIRCMVNVLEDKHGAWVEFTSASGKPLYNLDCFADKFLALAKEYGVVTFDCGVLINGSFDTTRRVVRSSKNGYDTSGSSEVTIWETKPTKKREGVLHFRGVLATAFYLYDLPHTHYTYSERMEMMRLMEGNTSWRLLHPTTTGIMSVSTVEELYDRYTSAGLEGLMLKRLNFNYVFGRSSDWMKMKPENEKDGFITGYTEGLGKFAGLIGSVEIDFGDGTSTSVSGMDDATRQKLSAYKSAYLGRVVRVPYMERDTQGGYRHPRWGGFHEDKTKADVLSAPNS